MEIMNTLCLQEKYAPQNACFGCGVANAKGLRIKSFAKDSGEVVASFRPEPHHEAFPGVLNGGIIGTLLDCHSNWTAAWHLMHALGLTEPPCTVTAEYTIKLMRPTPTDRTLELSATVIELKTDHAFIQAKLLADNKVCATCQGKFVAVKEGHPAYHRW